MSYKKSTWRKDRVALKADTVYTHVFMDTKPNHILISNSSASQIFVSPSSLTSANMFDVIVPPYGTRLYAEEEFKDRVSFLVEGVDANISITSWEGVFNPASVSQSQEIVATSSSGLLGVIDVNNFLNPLPAGTNKIGQVDVASLPALPAGNAKIGQVDVATLPAMTRKGLTAILVTANAPGNIVVKGTPGNAYKLIPDTGYAGTVQLTDNGNAKWVQGSINFESPIACGTNIGINFGSAGSAWLLYE